MASLASTLKNNQKLLKRGPGGQLSEESTEEIQSLAGKAGLQAPPTTALGQSLIGANKDQQKMAGSPAQMGKALSLSTDPSQTLADARRRTQVRTEQTTGEQEQAEKSQNLQALGGLGDRVGNFIAAQREKLQQDAAAATGVETKSATEFANRGGETTDLAPIADTLASLRADPNNMQLQLEVNKYLGRDVNSTLAPEEIDQLYESATSAVSRAGATAVDDDLTVEDLSAIPEFGYNTSDLSGLLGVSEDDLKKMNVAQLRDLINKTTEQEFGQTQQVDQQSVSGQLGAAERALAQQAGQEASATGLRTAEQNALDINQQIANADTILFGGKEWKIDELLKDENISSIVEQYMDAPPGSPERAELERTEPGLSEFIKKNQALFDEASKQTKAGGQEFTTIQKENLAAKDFGESGALTDEVAKLLIPGYGELAASRMDKTTVPALAYLSEKQGPEQKTAIQNVNSFAQNYPEYNEQLRDLSKDELDKLGFHSGNFGEIIRPIQEKKLVQTTNNVDDIIRTMSGGALGANSTQDFKQANAAFILGLAPKDQTISMIDGNNDGLPDDINSIRQRALGSDPKNSTSLKNLLNGTFNAVYKQPPKQEIPASGAAGSLMQRMGTAAGDGRITGDEITGAYERATRDIPDSGLATNLINELLLLQKSKGLDSNAQGKLGEQLTKVQKVNTMKFLMMPAYEKITAAPQIGNLGKKYQAQADAANLFLDNVNSKNYSSEDLKFKISELLATSNAGNLNYETAMNSIKNPSYVDSQIEGLDRLSKTTGDSDYREGYRKLLTAFQRYRKMM